MKDFICDEHIAQYWIDHARTVYNNPNIMTLNDIVIAMHEDYTKAVSNEQKEKQV